MPIGAPDAIALGPPSVLATWAFDVLRQAAAIAPHRAAIKIVDRENAAERPEADRAPYVYLSHFPSPSLVGECEVGQAPILLLLDDPFDSVRYMRDLSKCGVLEALRLQTASVSTYSQIRGHPRLLTLHRLTRIPTAEIVKLILAHLGITLSPSELDTLLGRRPGRITRDAELEASLKAAVPGYAKPEDARGSFSNKEAAMIGGVLTPMLQMSVSGDPTPIVWPIETFLSGDRPDTPASLVAELTGGARILYYGPYLNLPAGSWTARMTVGFSEGAKKTPVTVEAYGGARLLAVASMVPEDKGIYHASFDFDHGDALQPVEVRVRTDRGAIEGRLALGKVELSLRRGAARRQNG
ncbi:MAG TPA: hypothetical protein VMI72_02125 [Roseiarcus sp.]|nr:hypothetical protein [Roseiarcus sp.]